MFLCKNVFYSAIFKRLYDDGPINIQCCNFRFNSTCYFVPYFHYNLTLISFVILKAISCFCFPFLLLHYPNHFFCPYVWNNNSFFDTDLSRLSISSLYSFLFSLTFHTGGSGCIWIVLSFLQIHFSFFSLSVFAFLCFWLCLDEFLDDVETNHTLSLFFCGETETVLSVNKDIDNNQFWVWRLPCYDISSLTCLSPFAEVLMLIYNRTRWKMQKVVFKLQLQDGVICFCVTTRSRMKACEARLCWIRIETTKQE